MAAHTRTFEPALDLAVAAMSRAVESLPAPHQRVLVLNEVGRLTSEGIGLALGIPRAQARVGLLQARQALSRRLTTCVRAAMPEDTFEFAKA